MKSEVLKQDYIQVDESTLPVIDNEKHRAVKGYMWCTRIVENSMVVFHYDMGSRSYDTANMVAENRRIGKAISYTYPLLPRLGRYVNNGMFKIDNNLVENAIRPLALGRKNNLFCDNHDAAIRAAIIYSLIS